MRHCVSVAVVTALTLAGCAAPGGTGAKVPMQAKVTRVQAMTKTFSFAKNPGLNTAAQSVKTLASALQGAFLSGASAMMPGVGGLAAGRVPPEDLDAAFASLRAAGLRATYRVSGVAELGGARLTYDDRTGEVTGVTGPNAQVRFEFRNDGRRRSWDAVIDESPDGTTGRFHIEVTGAWRPNRLGALMGELAPATPAPPYRWFNDEVPESVEAVAISLDVVPRGDAALAFRLTGTLDEPQRLPNTAMKVPTHWTCQARIPKVELAWESRMRLAAGASTLDGQGTMAVEADAGREPFTFALKADERTRAASFELTNVNAKVTLALGATQPDAKRRPEVTALLRSAEDGSPIGTVALDPRRPRFAIVTFADQSTSEWELYPEDLFVPAAADQR